MKNDKDKLNKNHSEAEAHSGGELHTEQAPKKNKKPGRWTAVDTVILLMLLLGVGGILLRGFLPDITEGANRGEDVTSGPYFVEFAVSEIHPLVLGEINAFDPLYLYETGEPVGYIGVYDNGSMALHTVASSANNGSGNVSAEGCMVCLEGIYRNGSLLIKGMDTYLSTGSTLLLRTDRAVMSVEITSIRTVE